MYADILRCLKNKNFDEVFELIQNVPSELAYDLIKTLIESGLPSETIDAVLGLPIRYLNNEKFITTYDRDSNRLTHQAIIHKDFDVLQCILSSTHCSQDLLKTIDSNCDTVLHAAMAPKEDSLDPIIPAIQILLNSGYYSEYLILYGYNGGETPFQLLFKQSSSLPLPLNIIFPFLESCEPELLQKILFDTNAKPLYDGSYICAMENAINYDRKLHLAPSFNPTMFENYNPETAKSFFSTKGLKSIFLPRLVQICARKGIITPWVRYKLFVNGYFSLAFTWNQYPNPTISAKAEDKRELLTEAIKADEPASTNHPKKINAAQSETEQIPT